MSEVAITKRLQKAISKRSVNPVERQLIRHMEALRQKYEAERSALVVNLSLDTRFKRCHPLAAQLVGSSPAGPANYKRAILSRTTKLQKKPRAARTSMIFEGGKDKVEDPCPRGRSQGPLWASDSDCRKPLNPILNLTKLKNLLRATKTD